MSVRKLIFEGTAGDRLVARLELPVGEEPIAYALFAHCLPSALPLPEFCRIRSCITVHCYAYSQRAPDVGY